MFGCSGLECRDDPCDGWWSRSHGSLGFVIFERLIEVVFESPVIEGKLWLQRGTKTNVLSG